MLVHGKELIFHEGEHVYTWGGQPVPGVTTILKVIDKPALIQWSAGMASDHFLAAIKSGREDLDAIHKESKVAHRKKAKDAANIGQNVHEYAECYLKGLPLPELLSDPAKRGVEAFHKWTEAHKIKLTSSERRLFSRQYYFAGTCDLDAEIDGKRCVGDFKTSSGIYPEMRFQTAAYQQALQEELGIKYDSRWIIRFDKKTGKFEAKEFTNFDLDFSGFEAALNLHKTLQAMAG